MPEKGATLAMGGPGATMNEPYAVMPASPPSLTRSTKASRLCGVFATER